MDAKGTKMVRVTKRVSDIAEALKEKTGLSIIRVIDDIIPHEVIFTAAIEYGPTRIARLDHTSDTRRSGMDTMIGIFIEALKARMCGGDNAIPLQYSVEINERPDAKAEVIAQLFIKWQRAANGEKGYSFVDVFSEKAPSRKFKMVFKSGDDVDTLKEIMIEYIEQYILI